MAETQVPIQPRDYKSHPPAAKASRAGRRMNPGRGREAGKVVPREREGGAQGGRAAIAHPSESELRAGGRRRRARRRCAQSRFARPSPAQSLPTSSSSALPFSPLFFLFFGGGRKAGSAPARLRGSWRRWRMKLRPGARRLLLLLALGLGAWDAQAAVGARMPSDAPRRGRAGRGADEDASPSRPGGGMSRPGAAGGREEASGEGGGLAK